MGKPIIINSQQDFSPFLKHSHYLLLVILVLSLTLFLSLTVKMSMDSVKCLNTSHPTFRQREEVSSKYKLNVDGKVANRGVHLKFSQRTTINSEKVFLKLPVITPLPRPSKFNELKQPVIPGFINDDLFMSLILTSSSSKRRIFKRAIRKLSSAQEQIRRKKPKNYYATPVSDYNYLEVDLGDKNNNRFVGNLTSAMLTSPHTLFTDTVYYYSNAFKLVATFFMSAIFMIGLAGNIMVVLVVTVLTTSPGMRISTNVYLVSLAVADCMSLLAAVPEQLVSNFMAVNRWVLGGKLTCSGAIFLQYLSINASALSITAFTVERYLAISYPLKAQILCSYDRAQKIVVGVWVFSLLYSCPWLFLTSTFPMYILVKHEDSLFNLKTQRHNLSTTNNVSGNIDSGAFYRDSNATTMSNSIIPSVNKTYFEIVYQWQHCNYVISREAYLGYYMTDLIVFYVLPLLISFVCYGLIIRILFKSSRMTFTSSETKEPLGIGKSGCKVEYNNIDHQPMCRKSLFMLINKDARHPSHQPSKISHSSGDDQSFLNLSNTAVSEIPRVGRNPSTDNRVNHNKKKTLKEYVHIGKIDKFKRGLANPNILNAFRSDKWKKMINIRNTHSPKKDRGGANISSYKTMNKEKPVHHLKSHSTSIRIKMQVIKMLVVVVCLFALLWMPYRILVVYNSYASAQSKITNLWYKLFCRLMVFINNATNPFLYSLLSVKFRSAFRKLCSCRCSTCSHLLCLSFDGSKKGSVNDDHNRPTADYPTSFYYNEETVLSEESLETDAQDHNEHDHKLSNLHDLRKKNNKWGTKSFSQAINSLFQRKGYRSTTMPRRISPNIIAKKKISNIFANKSVYNRENSSFSSIRSYKGIPFDCARKLSHSDKIYSPFPKIASSYDDEENRDENMMVTYEHDLHPSSMSKPSTHPKKSVTFKPDLLVQDGGADNHDNENIDNNINDIVIRGKTTQIPDSVTSDTIAYKNKENSLNNSVPNHLLMTKGDDGKDLIDRDATVLIPVTAVFNIHSRENFDGNVDEGKPRQITIPEVTNVHNNNLRDNFNTGLKLNHVSKINNDNIGAKRDLITADLNENKHNFTIMEDNSQNVGHIPKINGDDGGKDIVWVKRENGGLYISIETKI